MANKSVWKSMDGNEAAAYAAYALTEVAAIYPITPSSPMAEHVDEWASKEHRKNVFGTEVKVVEMQAEGGAAGALHGVLQAGTLGATFTASQGLLLMIPNLYKLSGELLPGVLHVAARSLAGRSLNIFGDHEDVYATRQTGICILASNSVQEAMDLGGVAHLSAIKASVPFLHFFDGFRTSHEIQKIELMDYDFLRSLVDYDAVKKFKARALNPHNNPVTRGGNENDDIFFQGKEAANLNYEAVADVVADYMKKVSEHTGRDYAPFTYYGAKDATRVIVAMGSVCETIEETVDKLNEMGEKVGLVKVHLYRPFSVKYLLKVLPETVKKVAVLDRTKEIGTREPLYLDIREALHHHPEITIIGGRYGLGSKDTQPNQIKAVYDELNKAEPKEEFTIGINDDVTHLSLSVDPSFHTDADYSSCLFYGLGSDGTVGANKNSIKIIGDHTDLKIQAYFQYDSKKSGGTTRSHLRFGKSPIRSTYYIRHADFISCSLDAYCFKFDMAKDLKEGGTFLLNTTIKPEEIEKRLPNRMLAELALKKAKFYIIDATDIAMKTGMGGHTNTILQSAFFKLNEQIMPYADALNYMKDAAKATYAKKGEDVVKANCDAIDQGGSGVVAVEVKPEWAKLMTDFKRQMIGDKYFDEHVSMINSLQGDDLPVSDFRNWDILDGSIHNDISFKEKRNIATMVPQWNPALCVQCGTCSFVCSHATIRTFLLTDEEVKNAPEKFETIPGKGNDEAAKLQYRVQIAPMDCVGCGLCANECPTKALKMVPVAGEVEHEPLADYLFKHTTYKEGIFPRNTIKGSQFLMPYFEISGSCGGCGEAPYYRLASQLFGRDMLVANATGCSMIYCSATPSTPFVTDKNGDGIAWANSLFEDNAEYGYGMAISRNYKNARILSIMEDNLDSDCHDAFQKYLDANGDRDKQRACKDEVLKAVKDSKVEAVKELLDYDKDLVGKSVWIIGGDGWAYDIGYGGLDHVLANNLNVNVLVLDTEVYSNTGGQSSKSSQAASIAEFAAGGKTTAKKDLGEIAMSYGHIYVASVAMGANRMQTIKAFIEAESYNGPSLILAYSPCLLHGIKGGLKNHQKAQREAVACGYVNLYRFDPRNEKPLTIDSGKPDFSKYKDFILNENRYRNLMAVRGVEAAEAMYAKSQKDAEKRYNDLLNRLGH